jgi:glycosyltransferase involved in cell wall biosynthesis
MKVLQLSHKPPYPPKDGGCLAIDNITQGLISAGVEIKILTIETAKHPFEDDRIPKEYLEKTGIESVFVDTKLNVVDAFSNFITSDSYNITRFFTPDFDHVLINELKTNEYDIIHLESLFMTPYISTIRMYSDARIVLRSHNLEYIIWERLSKQTGNVAKKTYLKLLAKQLKKYERSVLNQVDGIAPISKRDAADFRKLGAKQPIEIIPFGLNINKYKPSDYTNTDINLFHLGSMDWEPNLEGLDWFLENIWPVINTNEPALNFYIAGRDMPERYFEIGYPNVVVVGEVEDAVKFIKSKSLMIVPLLSGGGIRVKIIEGMALGKAIISTSVGAEGIHYTHKKDIWIADTPNDFAEAVSFFKNNPEKIIEMGNNARKLVEKEYTNEIIISKLISFYKLLQTRSIKNPGRITASN